MSYIPTAASLANHGVHQSTAQPARQLQPNNQGQQTPPRQPISTKLLRFFPTTNNTRTFICPGTGQFAPRHRCAQNQPSALIWLFKELMTQFSCQVMTANVMTPMWNLLLPLWTPPRWSLSIPQDTRRLLHLLKSHHPSPPPRLRWWSTYNHQVGPSQETQGCWHSIFSFSCEPAGQPAHKEEEVTDEDTNQAKPT